MSYKHGIDCIEKADVWLKDKRVGLITNYTGLTTNFKRTADVVNERYNLTKLFAPEHGLYGTLQAGDDVGNTVDVKTNLPVISMFSEENQIDFSGLDVICYDIQDLGLRFYTHISVLANAMKECGRIGIPLVVFDRFNPLGLDRVSGTLLEEKYSSFVGMYPVPSQYGLTTGEYALYINEQQNINCDLHIVSCQDLKRSDSFSTLNIPWIAPSPNIPTFETAIVYVGTVLFEGTNISEGRGTTKPFEYIGAPFIDGLQLADTMNSKQFPGVWFREIQFVPTFSKYKDICCNGVQIHITDYDKFDSFLCGLSLLDTIRHLYKEFECDEFLNNLLGTDAFIGKDFDLQLFAQEQNMKISSFTNRVKPYYLY